MRVERGGESAQPRKGVAPYWEVGNPLLPVSETTELHLKGVGGAYKRSWFATESRLSKGYNLLSVHNIHLAWHFSDDL